MVNHDTFTVIKYSMYIMHTLMTRNKLSLASWGGGEKWGGGRSGGGEKWGGGWPLFSPEILQYDTMILQRRRNNMGTFKIGTWDAA